MPTLTFHGGIGEIGGNQILLEHASGRLFLDFGRNFEREGRYFEEPWVTPFYAPDLETIQAIPRLEGIYRHQDDAPSRPCSVLLSHAHADHFGYVPLLCADTDVYLGEDTHQLIDIRIESSRSTWQTERDHLDWHDFRTGDRLDISPVEASVKPIHVDHSVPASYGFLVEVDGKTLAYTGDLRSHGHRADLTADFIAELTSAHVDLLLCEGTRIQPEGTDPDLEFMDQLRSHLAAKSAHSVPTPRDLECTTEEQVEDRLATEFGSDALFLVDVSPLDVDRIRSLWRAAQRANRLLVLTARQAYMCYEASHRTQIKDLPGPADAGLYLSQRRAAVRDRVGQPEDYETFKKGREKWEQTLVEDWEADGGEVFHGPEGREDLRAHPNRFVLCSPQAANLFPELAYRRQPCDISFVLSKSEPFNEEMLMSFDRLLNWLHLYGCNEYVRAHVSGHATTADVKALIEAANPTLVVPIHTRHASMFTAMHDNVNAEILRGQRITL